MMEVVVEVCRAFVLTVSAEEDRDHVHASTAYTADDGAINSRIGRENLQTGAILHLPGGCRS